MGRGLGVKGYSRKYIVSCPVSRLFIDKHFWKQRLKVTSLFPAYLYAIPSSLLLFRMAVGCVYGFTVVDVLKGDIIHVQSTYDSSGPDMTHMSRMQSIRRSFRQSLKRINVRHSMRGNQSTQRSYRPSNFVRSGSARPSVAKSKRGGGAATLTPPPKRDLIKTLTFTAPCQITGN